MGPPPINNLEELFFCFSEQNWNYEVLNKNPSITEHLVLSFHPKKWNYNSLSSNPAIHLQFILQYPSKKWNSTEFAKNPSLDVHEIDTMIQIKGGQQLNHFIKNKYLRYHHDDMPHTHNNVLERVVNSVFIQEHTLNLCHSVRRSVVDNNQCSIKHFINLSKKHATGYLQCNHAIKHDLKKLVYQMITNPICFNSIYLEHSDWTLFLSNINLGNTLLYGFLKMMQQYAFVVWNPLFMQHLNADERIYQLFHETLSNYPMRGLNAHNNSVSLEFLIQYHQLRQYFQKTFQNPSIIQSIYQIYNGKGSVTTIQPIIAKTPYHHVYYEDCIIFTPDMYLQFHGIEHPLLAFSANPNLDWEFVADFSWKPHNFKLLSSNSTTQHPHYRKAQIMQELETLGFSLPWNSLEDVIEDDFDLLQLLQSFEMTSSSNNSTTSSTTSTASKKQKLTV